MKRAEVWWVSFPASTGGEIQKERPAVIVSNDASNKHLNRVQVVPMTSKVDRVYPSEAVIQVRARSTKRWPISLRPSARLVSRIESVGYRHRI